MIVEFVDTFCVTSDSYYPHGTPTIWYELKNSLDCGLRPGYDRSIDVQVQYEEEKVLVYAANPGDAERMLIINVNPETDEIIGNQILLERWTHGTFADKFSASVIDLTKLGEPRNEIDKIAFRVMSEAMFSDDFWRAIKVRLLGESELSKQLEDKSRTILTQLPLTTII